MTATREDTRTRILDAASHLLHEGGSAAVTTRGVAEAAGVQAPTIYRLFGDKDGLLDAVAEHAMALHASAKAAVVAAAEVDDVDPLTDLRAGWEAQLEFALTHPSVFRLLSDPERVRSSAAARVGREVLRTRLHRVAAAGRLRVPLERAVDLVQAAGTGVVQTLLTQDPEHRDAGLADALYEAVLRQILLDADSFETQDAGAAVAAAAVSLRAVASTLPGLSGPERDLLAEWLDRVAQGAGVRAS
jgi:AcrR family transcriptional regulator